jgi:hypothetical protein
VPADKTGAINQRRQYIAPVSGLLGKPAPAGSDTGASAAAGQTPPAYTPPSPMELAGLSLGQALGNMSNSVGGGSQIADPPDPPAVRTPALDMDFMPPSANPVPASLASGVGSQLGSLAIQTQPEQLTDPSITQGAPSMTAMLNQVGGGGENANLYDPRRPPTINPSLRLSRLG